MAFMDGMTAAGGMATGQAKRDEYPHERAAREWAVARNELDDAKRRAEEATKRLGAAAEEEEYAWLVLQAAKRGEPPPPRAPRPEDMPSREFRR